MKSSPLTGKYLVKNFGLILFLKTIDFCTSHVFFFRKKQGAIKQKKILLSNIAHLGDVVISTAILPVIKKKFVDCKIGFLCSSVSSELLMNHPYIYKVHIVDHWKLNRSGNSFFKKFLIYIHSRSKVIKEIRNENYDVAIDLYTYFPNTIYLLWKSGIKKIIGYTSAGFGNFLDCKLDWTNQDKHVSSYHFELVKFLGITEEYHHYMKMTLPVFSSKEDKIMLPDNYFLFHIGAGDEKKMWNLNKWKQLTQILVKKGKNIIFTGKGIAENNQINEIVSCHEKCLNLCNKLNILELMDVINRAQCIVCSDSLVLHLSTVLNKLTFVIFCGINNYHHWVLNKNNIHPILPKTLDCIPCYKKNGCDTMDCLKTIHVEDVLHKMGSVFE